MGFFSDLKEDLSQAVNELLPDESKTGAKESRYKTLAEFQDDPDFSKLMVFPIEEEDKKSLVSPANSRGVGKSGSRLEFTLEDSDEGTNRDAGRTSLEFPGEEILLGNGFDSETMSTWSAEKESAPWRAEKVTESAWNGEAEKAAKPVWNMRATKESWRGGTMSNQEKKEADEAEAEQNLEEAAAAIEAEENVEEAATAIEAEENVEETVAVAEAEENMEAAVTAIEADENTEEAVAVAETEENQEAAVKTIEAEENTEAAVTEAEENTEAAVAAIETQLHTNEVATEVERGTEIGYEMAAESEQEESEVIENTIIADGEAEKGRKNEMDLDEMLNDALAGGRLGVEVAYDQEDDKYGSGEMLDETAIITGGMTITGDVASQGSMNVEGMINGNLDILGKLNITGAINGNSRAAEIYADGAKINGEVVSEGTVKIGASSVIIGNISAKSAVIAGAVKGDIDVRGPVILDTSAIVMGNIKSKSVQINNGAVIEGMCSQCYADVNPTSFFDEYKPEIKNVKLRRD